MRYREVMLRESYTKEQVSEAAWWLTRWISGSMNDPDWDDTWTTMDAVQAFSILHDVVGNKLAIASMLWRRLTLSRREAALMMRTKRLKPHAFPYQSFSTSKQVALEHGPFRPPDHVAVLISARPAANQIAFSMGDLKRSRNPAILDALRQLDLWHYQKEVLVRVTEPLSLLSVEIV